MSGDKLKIMVASTIYGFSDQIEQICAMINSYNGYEVWNSHMKTIPVNPALSNPQNCINAVKECDLIFGIITPRYGAVLQDDISITHQEIRTSIATRKPRWFIVHRDIRVARTLLKQYRFDDNNNPIAGFTYRSTPAMDDIRLVDLHDEAILNDVLPEDRVGHWVDQYFNLNDILRCIETQFKDVARVRDIVNQMNQGA